MGCTCGIGDAEFHLNGCALASHLPFEGWQRGGMTHFENCWQGHLTCALLYATDLLADAVEELAGAGVYEGAGDSPWEDFINYIADHR